MGNQYRQHSKWYIYIVQGNMMSEYGYIPESPEQSFGNNKGIFTPKDIYDLTRADKYTNYGQLELIETKTISSGSTLNFTSIGEDVYNVHFVTANNIESSSANTGISIRLSNDSGSTYEAGTSYEKAVQYGGAIGNGESNSTGTSALPFTSDTANQNKGGYCYLYNLGDSTKYSFQTFQSIEESYYQYGSGLYKTADEINAIQFLTTNTNVWTGTISLYGIKEYS